METFQSFQQYESGDSQQTQKRTCETCGADITKQFVRVFGGNDGAAHGCMNWTTGRDLREDGGRQPTAIEQAQSSVDAD